MSSEITRVRRSRQTDCIVKIMCLADRTGLEFGPVFVQVSVESLKMF